MARNPFLPKRPIRWQAGSAKGTVGLPALPVEATGSLPSASELSSAYRKDPRGRKPKDRSLKPKMPEPPVADSEVAAAPISFLPDAGRLRPYESAFFTHANYLWGSAVDLVTLAHGPVGCGLFVQTMRINLPSRIQGIDGFTALHFSSGIEHEHHDGMCDKRLETVLEEIEELFPLAKGILVLTNSALERGNSNPRPVSRRAAQKTGKLVLPLACQSYGMEFIEEQASALQSALLCEREAVTSPYDVAMTFGRTSAALVWIVRKLLEELGLNVIHEATSTSAAELARVTRCKLAIGFALSLDVPEKHLAHGFAHNLGKWFSMPLQWCCFASPAATDASLRQVASHFDRRIRQRAEAVIARNKKHTGEIIAKYRPRLAGKLILHFSYLSREELEPFQLLGLRIGNATGWEGKSGTWRKPRIQCDPEKPSDKAIDALITEAKPDLVLYAPVDEMEWFKRAMPTLRETPFSSNHDGRFWGYDGFACMAAELDRLINAPWRNLVSAPWDEESG